MTTGMIEKPVAKKNETKSYSTDTRSFCSKLICHPKVPKSLLIFKLLLLYGTFLELFIFFVVTYFDIQLLEGNVLRNYLSIVR